MKGMGTIPGVSDILAVRPSVCPQCGFGPLGILHALELTAGTRPPTEAQLAFIAGINAAGGYAAVAHDLDAALASLEAWKLLIGKAS